MNARFPSGWSRTGGRRCVAPAVALAVTMLLSACGGSRPARHTAANRGPVVPRVCASSALEVIARTLAVRASTIATAPSSGNNAMPQCTFTTSLPHDRRVEVIVNVDTGPQPYFVLERTIVEASQIFSGVRLSPAPVAVTALGLEAAWFPAETHLMATDGIRLVTTTINWPGANQTRETALARAVTRPYLKTPHGKAAQALADGYPSG